MSMKEDLKTYPVYLYQSGEIVRVNITNTSEWNHYEMEMHHYIKAQRMKYKDFEKIKHLQKLILMPKIMHRNLHDFIPDFYEKWGMNISDLLYGYRGLTENE